MTIDLNYNEDNDLSNIQVNIFRVRGPLRDISPSEKVDFLHNEVFIFNPKNFQNPEISGIKLKNHKIIKNKIYLSDSIEVLLNKIAIHCESDISGKEKAPYQSTRKVSKPPKPLFSLSQAESLSLLP